MEGVVIVVSIPLALAGDAWWGEGDNVSFWPVIVRMDSAVAQAFLADLTRVIEQKSEGG